MPQFKYFMISMAVLALVMAMTLLLERACSAEEMVPEWALKAQLRERSDFGRPKF